MLKDRAVSCKGQTQLPKSSVCQPLDNLRGALGCLSSVCVCVVSIHILSCFCVSFSGRAGRLPPSATAVAFVNGEKKELMGKIQKERCCPYMM